MDASTDKERDHKKLGKELDLFTFSELVGSGLPLWTPKGTILRDLLDDFVWEMRSRYGYEKVEIPHITKRELYEKSGHWDKFKEDLFRITTREGDEFALKPMNCPHHTQIYARKPWSYRELPQRYANTTMCYRDEQSGELNGLSRVRAFTQDDAHCFCRESQVKEEFMKIWNIVDEFYSTFGFKPKKIRLSFHDPKHPDKYLGDKNRWKIAEDILNSIAKGKDVETIDGAGEAAFYGPKLDFMAEDAHGRLWQVATIQLDMNMPERFDLTCINEKGEKERIVMIHAAIMGSIERFLSVLIEHLQGAFPLWLSPVQARVLSVSEKHTAYAHEVEKELKAAGIRADSDDANESLGKKIRNAKTEKIPYLLVVGDAEVEAKTVSVDSRDHGKLDSLSIGDFIARAHEEIKRRG
ncbi:threonine--tRNA ligase [Candidatus Kaiserbacteria bacterium RIFCSPLOWO2_01_FULL_55_19]|uniref:Threonine--tRNA ligase n=1 Tax=Candidatus Kaiserbacteria bacterium RIFCSPLOWO2_01_FULL_55_19 TaxID=1798516 RepID=A0A1F6ERV0_9BACT|nr:MAG: threonine--tRNA ligase [Candidatus Kaiserbacteria bacterium RIFCSPLOWO2_01_FULL_55_19]